MKLWSKLLAAALLVFSYSVANAAPPITPNAVNGCYYNASPITVSDKQPVPFQCTANGALIVQATISTVGLATSANQTNGNQKTQIVDGSGNVISSTGNALDVNIKTGFPTTIAVTQSTSPWVISGTVTANAGTNLNTSALALETGGNLATVAGSITAGVQQTNEKQINGVAPLMGNGVTGTGSQRVTIASDNTAFAVNAVESGTWNITNISGTVSLPTGAATAAKQPALGTAGTPSTDVLTVQGAASMTPLFSVVRDAAGNARGANVNASNQLSVSVDGTNTVTQSGTWTVQPGNTPNTTPWLVTLDPGTSGGLSNFVLEPTASDNHANIKNGAGQVYHIVVFNNSATVNYIRLYNAGTAFNGCNSATNLLWEGHIPASTSDAGFVEDIGEGLSFATGVSICVTSTYGQTSVASATASAMSIDVMYK